MSSRSWRRDIMTVAPGALVSLAASAWMCFDRINALTGLVLIACAAALFASAGLRAASILFALRAGVAWKKLALPAACAALFLGFLSALLLLPSPMPALIASLALLIASCAAFRRLLKLRALSGWLWLPCLLIDTGAFALAYAAVLMY